MDPVNLLLFIRLIHQSKNGLVKQAAIYASVKTKIKNKRSTRFWQININSLTGI